ncbi:hypothetical protein MRX96_008954 [Rhipicephalus microplus]
MVRERKDDVESNTDRERRIESERQPLCDAITRRGKEGENEGEVSLFASMRRQAVRITKVFSFHAGKKGNKANIRNQQRAEAICDAAIGSPVTSVYRKRSWASVEVRRTE